LAEAGERRRLHLTAAAVLSRRNREKRQTPGVHLMLVLSRKVAEKIVLTIATVRPETIMADAAICVNPNDERYKHLKGKKAIIPLIDRAIPIIEDDYVTMDFGTGCLKVTPAHDMNDNELGKKHNLDVIDILNEDGTLNAKAKIFVGDDRFVARKKIAKELEQKGYLTKIEDYQSNVGFSERTDAVIEPRLSLQWFLKMKEITRPAHEHVMNDDIQLIPSKFKNTYNHWMSNVRDWCISRQLWWGHQIPVFYCNKCEHQWASEEKPKNCPKCETHHFHQDPDVLDTWFSSGIWPLTTLGWPDHSRMKTRGFDRFFPTSVLVTGYDIIFF
jgi:valyl-tRNA synthetase